MNKGVAGAGDGMGLVIAIGVMIDKRALLAFRRAQDGGGDRRFERGAIGSMGWAGENLGAKEGLDGG